MKKINLPLTGISISVFGGSYQVWLNQKYSMNDVKNMKHEIEWDFDDFDDFCERFESHGDIIASYGFTEQYACKMLGVDYEPFRNSKTEPEKTVAKQSKKEPDVTTSLVVKKPWRLLIK
jgi:hypothetical protein